MRNVWLAVVVVLVAVAGQLYAQADRATIEGVVCDSGNEPIPGARVVIHRMETNDEVLLWTNQSGRYYLPNLPIGTYGVTVEREGFQRAQRDGIKLQSQMTTRSDFQMELGSLTTTIEVNSDGTMLDNSTPGLTSQLTTKVIQDSPLITFGRKRDITAFLQQLPGVTTASTWAARVNGSNPGNSEVFLDGAPASQTNARGAIQENGPAIEHVGEFSVVANSFNAEYGRTGSWFTNITIRSGANAAHGSVFDYFNNDALNARSFFQKKRTLLRQNEGGVTFAGPVRLPGIYNGRNRTFFFVGQQIVYWNQSRNGALITAPRGDYRQGDFSSLLSASGAVIPLFDPATSRATPNGEVMRDQFPSNHIPASRISPISRRILALIPQPDVPSLAVNNFYGRTGGGSYGNYVTTIKVDHSFSNRHKLSVTYIDQFNPRVISGQGWGTDSPLEGSQSPKLIHDRTGRLNYDFIARSNMLNHLTVGADRYRNQTRQVSQFEGWNDMLGIRGVTWDQGAFPVVSFSGGAASPQGLGGPDFSTNTSGRITLSDTLAWIWGRHSLKFGATYWPEYANATEGYLSSGSFSFTNLTTSQPNAAQYTSWGSSLASFLLGDVSTGYIAEPYSRGARYRSGGAFAQDEWRMNNSLTLSYGLRWEWNAAPFEPLGRASGFDSSVANQAAGGWPGALVFAGKGAGRRGSNALSDGWFKGFAPRLGLAFSATPRTVIRSSLSLYYAPGFRTRMIAYGFTNSSAVNSSNGYTAAYQWDERFPPTSARAPHIDPSYQNGRSVSSILPGTSRMPQILSWTFGIQRELTPDMAFEATYIGSHSTHLILSQAQSNMNTLDAENLALQNLLFQDIESGAAAAAGFSPPYPSFLNQRNRTVGQSIRPYPQYLDVTEEWGPHGIARYHALQAKLTRRYSKGLALLTFYSWSKNMTNVEGGPIDLGPSDGAIQYPRNRAGEVSVSTDGSPHVFVASGTWELPVGPGRRLSTSRGIASAFLAGWQVSFFLRYAAGLPLTISSGNPLSALGFPAVRANYRGGVVYVKANPREFDPAAHVYLNRAAFAPPPAFELGNTARVLSWVRGFTQKSEAISVAKTIPIRERVRVVLRADAQNPFNFVRWNNPVTNITDTQFGRVTSTASGRAIQLYLALAF
ncbi:MAG: TonB-dependent receptor [Bryobacterales bacterium]|nr:TonB-dependent receptor [Bryobacterales bacterium]